MLPWRAGACREDPIADNGSATQSKNVSVMMTREMGIMSIFVNSLLTPHPVRAIGGTLPPDAVSLLVAGPVAVGTNVPKVP